jgi:hypothetical protein
MPDYPLQYDLSANYIEANGHNRSSVYRYLARRLHERGWTTHQYSCWSGDNKAGVVADNDAFDVADQIEAQYGVGVFLRFEYQRSLHFVQVR